MSETRSKPSLFNRSASNPVVSPEQIEDLPHAKRAAALACSGSMPVVNGDYVSQAVPTPNMAQPPVPPVPPVSVPRTVKRTDRRAVVPPQNAPRPAQSNPVPEQPPKRPPFTPQPWMRYTAAIAAVLVIALILRLVISSVRQNRQEQATLQQVTAYNDLFCNGVYVDGIHLGSMTQQQAMDAVTTAAQQSLASWNVQLTFQGQTVVMLNASSLGLTVNIADALNAAWAQGHTGTIEQRKESMDALLTEPFYTQTSESEVDLAMVEPMLAGLEEALYIAPQDASVATFDASRTNPFTFTEEVVGRQLDLDLLKSQLTDMLATKTSGAIELQVTYKNPDVTVEYLKANIVTERATAYTDISTSSTDNRNNNIRQCFAKINGTVVKPGETFSFNGVVGDRTKANGFYEAMEYVYGTEQMGIGGGSCQASTTVYQAAVYAGMTIVERSPHSLVVNYSAFGKDATVNSMKGHRVDLKFRNDTPYPVYIKAAVESKDGNRNRLVTRVTIYGCAKGQGVVYDFDVIEEVIPAPEEAQIVVDKDDEYVTYETEEYEYQKAKDGTKVTSYHVKYVNGVEESRTFLDTDTYNPRPRILYVGATPVE